MGIAKRTNESGGVFAALVVILFLLTLMGVCGLFYWEKEQLLKKYETDKERLTQETISLKEELVTARADKERSEQSVKNIEVQYQSLKEQYATLEAEYKKTADLKAYIEEKFTSYTQTTKDGWTKLDSLSTRLDKQISSFFSGVNKEKQDKKKVVVKSDENTVDLPQVVVKKEPLVKEKETPAVEAAPAPAPKVIDAQIMSVNKEHNFVVLNKGLVDGMKVGDSIDVIRNSESIATIKISEIRDFVSLGLLQSVKSGVEVKEGDSVVKK